jgi:hypothetical protein
MPDVLVRRWDQNKKEQSGLTRKEIFFLLRRQRKLERNTRFNDDDAVMMILNNNINFKVLNVMPACIAFYIKMIRDEMYVINNVLISFKYVCMYGPILYTVFINVPIHGFCPCSLSICSIRQSSTLGCWYAVPSIYALLPQADLARNPVHSFSSWKWPIQMLLPPEPGGGGRLISSTMHDLLWCGFHHIALNLVG